jgi:hypothetical protein
LGIKPNSGRDWEGWGWTLGLMEIRPKILPLAYCELACGMLCWFYQVARFIFNFNRRPVDTKPIGGNRWKKRSF